MKIKYVIRNLVNGQYYIGHNNYGPITEAIRYNNDIDGGQLMQEMYWTSLIQPCEVVKIYEHDES